MAQVGHRVVAVSGTQQWSPPPTILGRIYLLKDDVVPLDVGDAGLDGGFHASGGHGSFI
jgi:hypothetical protein